MSSASGITGDKGSGKSKATVIYDGQVILLDIRCDIMGGFQLNVTMTLFWKK